MKAKSAPQISRGLFFIQILLISLIQKILFCFWPPGYRGTGWRQNLLHFTQSAAGRPSLSGSWRKLAPPLKQLANLSDERVVEEWRQNPCFQAFCGMKAFQWQLPCEPSDFCHFRKRIGEGDGKDFSRFLLKFMENRPLRAKIVVDTTVQEKNITFPTDTKLRVKSHSEMLENRKEENLVLRRSYGREIKEAFAHHPLQSQEKNAKLRNSAIRRVKTTANALLNDIARKLTPQAREALDKELQIHSGAVNQKRAGKNKIYSLHEPEVFASERERA